MVTEKGEELFSYAGNSSPPFHGVAGLTERMHASVKEREIGPSGGSARWGSDDCRLPVAVTLFSRVAQELGWNGRPQFDTLGSYSVARRLRNPSYKTPI